MPTILKQILFSVSIAAVLLTPQILHAQQPSEPPLAPLPAAILAGKTAFVSNASGESLIATGVSELTYNEFYAAMKSWGHYQLVATPADADIVFEIHYTPDDQLHLALRDPKTHTILWAFTEAIRQAQLHSTARKNFDQAMTNLLNDVKKLASQ